jgi:hypothetical protein
MGCVCVCKSSHGPIAESFESEHFRPETPNDVERKDATERDSKREQPTAVQAEESQEPVRKLNSMQDFGRIFTSLHVTILCVAVKICSYVHVKFMSSKSLN